MSEHLIFDRTAVSRDVVHGKPHIAGTRVMVYQVLDLLAGGKSPAEVISEDYFPDLTPEDVYAFIAFNDENK